MKPLKLDADSSRTGKLEDMNAPWTEPYGLLIC